MKPIAAILYLWLLSSLPAFAQLPAQHPDATTPPGAAATIPATDPSHPAQGLAPGQSPPNSLAPGETATDTLAPGQMPADPSVVPADIGPDYVLGNEDAIVVNVWKEQNLTGSLIVRPDGRISLPLVGDLPAAGMTPMALAAEITDHLKKFMNNPTVTVTVTASNSRRIWFAGEIGHEGPIPLTRDMTMLQAIAAAGGPTAFANKKKIYILRGPTGKQQRIPFDYNKALKKGDMQGVTPMPGDTVVVP